MKKKNIKIVHIINYFQPKLGYQETFLAKEQIKKGHNVVVITSDRYYPFPNFKESYGQLLGNRKCGIGFKEEEGIPTYRLRTLFEIKYRIWLLGVEELIVKLKPDIVISHSTLVNPFRLAKLKSRGYKFRLIVDDHMHIMRKQNTIGKLYYFLKKKRIQKKLKPWVDKFVGITQDDCKYFENCGIPQKKIEYIPLGTDQELFRFDIEQRKKVRAKLGINDDDIFLLYTGKINQIKGVDILVEAFNILNIETKAYLLMIGNGSIKFKKALISNMKTEKSNHIIFHPFVPTTELPKYYNAADICIWPKGCTTSTLDAMGCSRPFIGGDHPAVREWLLNNNGIICKKGNNKALAKEIEYLCRDNRLRQEMGKRGRKLVETKFSWEIISKKFIECVM